MRLVLLVLVSLALAGCATPGGTLDPAPSGADFDDLESTAKARTILSDGAVQLDFEGVVKAGAGALGVAIHPDEEPLGTFAVDERVGYAELSVSGSPAPETTLAGIIADGEGRIQCTVIVGSDATCTVPAIMEDTWSIYVRAIQGAAEPDTPATASIILHPRNHVIRGDPLQGVDASIRFRVSDTGVDGAEDNIGVLADGTIFTQKNVDTMRSIDDGQTWERVSPPGNDQTSLDPMLFVDPIRGRVMVDHLYVACSALSWSDDAGETWITNPAACGRPVGDHQKIASGPNVLPVPVPAVYYTYSIPGVWASRSLDGGVTWTSAPVAGVDDGLSFANTGPIYADELGNVFIPLYVCNGEGSTGAGVSHDHGLTWKFVPVSDLPGSCYDPDPGLWSDTDGVVYMAYHRADGVYYSWSEDHGETWSEAVRVTPESLLSFVHVDAVAGGPGRLAIVYRATADSPKGPDGADGWAEWHLYVSFVEDANSASPTIRTGIVNDPATPVQVGPICTSGIACYGGSRNLLDFIDIAVGPDGRVYPTYTSGCEVGEPCLQPADSRAQVGLVGVQETGPRLFDGMAPWAAT